MTPDKLVAAPVAIYPLTVSSLMMRLVSPKEQGSANTIALIDKISDWDLILHNKHSYAIGRDAVEHLPCGVAYIQIPNDFAMLNFGDVIRFDHIRNQLRLLFRAASKHNFFFVTDQCNHSCLMCSQPPKNVDDVWRIDELLELIPLIKSDLKAITISGGEPFTYEEKLFRLLALCKDYLPTTTLQVLTNGCAFANPDTVEKWKKLNHPYLYPAIPLYGYEPMRHDYVVQSKGAFEKTVLGILRLANAGQRIALRTVLSKQTIPYLEGMAEWVGRNLPFIENFALMGMEDVGYSLANQSILWIDPVDYQKELTAAVRILDQRGISTSIFNLPYCVIPEELHGFATQSISDWKNTFYPECRDCIKQTTCAGFFSSGRTKKSIGVHPIR